jgi:hypothetical protein
VNVTLPPSAVVALLAVTVAVKFTLEPSSTVEESAATVIVVGAWSAHARTRLAASMDPRPDAQSYPVAAW